MPSLFTRIGNLFPGFRAAATPSPVPAVRTPEQRLAIVRDAQERLDKMPRRLPPRTEEKVPQNYGAGIAGQVWFLPFRDSATHDSPEIRAAMRLMPRNPYVKAAWWTQILSVASQDWQIHASEPSNPESEEQAKAFAAMLDDYTAGGRPGLVQSICTPLGPDGFTVAEKVWGYAERGRLEGKIVLNALKDKDPEYLRLKGDRYGDITTVSSTRKQGEGFPIGDFVFVRYLPIFNEPMGMAAYRAAYGEYWMLDTVEKLRAIHVEKRMAGMLLGEYDDDDQKGPLEDALRRAKTATWVSVPAGCKVTALALSTATEPDYKSFVESKQTGIVTGISGASLQILQGTIPNARGDTKVQKSTSDLFPWWLTMLVQEAVSSQIARDFIDFNYPYPAGGGYPRATLGAVSNAELLEMLQVLEAEQRVGLKVSKKATARALGVQLADPNDPDDVLAPAQPAGPPMGGMPGGSPFGFAEFGEVAAPHKFSSTHVPLTGAAAARILSLGQQVADDDLADDGRETSPHVTVRYGLHTDDPNAVAAVCRGHGPVTVSFGPASVFRGADNGKDYDVIKLDVLSPDLHRLNAALREIPHTDTHPHYKPHATIAYVKAGLGDQYARLFGKPAIAPATTDRIVFSDRWRRQSEVELGRHVSFGWQPAPTRTGGTKAVGTGENAGSVLYGADAETALAGDADSAGARADDDKDGGELRRLADQVKAGDVDAGVEVHRRASAYADAALAGERKPIDAATATAAWKQASTGLDGTHAEAIGSHLSELTAGASSDPGVLKKVFGGLVGAIKAAGSLGVKAVAAFARGVQRQLGPYGWWAASLGAAACIMAAPAAAAGLGLIGGWMALATTPGAAVAALSMRKVGAKLATRSAVNNWGYGRKFGEFGECITAGEVAEVLVERFGWKPAGVA